MEPDERHRLAELGWRVGAALTSKAPLKEQLRRCTDAIVLHADAAFARIWTLNEKDQVLELQVSSGIYTHTDGPHGRVPVGAFKIGLIAQEKEPHLTNDVQNDPRVSDQAWAKREGMVSFAGYPLVIEGRVVGVVALFARRPLTEVTLRAFEAIADQLAVAIDRTAAEESLRRSEQFERQLIGIVSHDLRNPLNAVLMAAEMLLKRDELDDRTSRTVLRIKSSAERAARMIRDLLDFTQARLSGRLQVDLKPVDLHELARNVVEEMELAHPDRRIEASHEGDGAGEWDPDRLSQVLTNLLGNALKYSPAGTIVRLRTGAGEAGWMSIVVANEGIPIPANRLPALFEPLQRATDQVDKTTRSIGLGLYIVKHIVEAHGGSVAVRSTEQDGTTFTVRLPRALSGQVNQP